MAARLNLALFCCFNGLNSLTLNHYKFNTSAAAVY